MPKCVDIVMYHFVRDLKNSRYPNIRGLDLRKFRAQIEYLNKNYTFISTEDALQCVLEGTEFPPNSILLTFDDGYIDHYISVLPILMEYGIKAFFSMPGKIIREKKVLDVNKIHFILAGTESDAIIRILNKKLDHYRGVEFDYPTNAELYHKLAHPNRYDNEKTIYIKRVLQAELPETIRNQITNELFYELVTDNENAFVSELYLSFDQVKMMKRLGMFLGIHGYEHYWFETLSREQYVPDLQNALDVFEDVLDKNQWIFCYPYGSYSDELIAHCKSTGCVAGFTVQPRVADLTKDDAMLLPRFDTNDYYPVSDQRNALASQEGRGGAV